MYFSTMPNIYYDFVINGVQYVKILKDVTTNVRVIRSILENITMYDEYDIVDGETPEIIASKIYGNTMYHWVIMMANNRYDYREDFPVTYTVLDKRVRSIYGDENIYDTHHYEDSNGFIVNSNNATAYAVSNFEYEERLNESKRRIKLISKNVLDAVVNQYSDMFQ